MKKFIEKLFKGKPHQKEESEKLPVSKNTSPVTEEVCQKLKNPLTEDLFSIPIPEYDPIYQEPEVLPSPPQIENTKTVSKVEPEVRDRVPIMRSEFNFLRYPFFDLSPRASKKDQIEVKEIIEEDGKRIGVLWRVSRNVRSDFPSVFARRVHKGIVEKKLNSMKKPVANMIQIGSLSEMCRELGITDSGKNKNSIKKALQNISTTRIETKGTYRVKEKDGLRRVFEADFGLYNGVYFFGERLPDGTTADCVYVELSSYFVQNFNSNFVVPLDYRYLQSLNGDIASRMYEVFSLWFYPVLEHGKDSIQKNYSELCNYFPLVPQNEKWKAKGQLKKSHDQHIESGFLAGVEWLSIPGKSDDWNIKYTIGPKAQAWYKSIKTDKPLEIESEPSPKPHRKNPAPLPEKLSSKDNPEIDNLLVAQLVDLGISKKVAESLVSLTDPDVIQDQIEALPYRKNIEDKPAFLIKAIEENYPLPDIIRNRRAKEEEEREKKLKDEYDKFIIIQVDEYLKTLDPQQVEQEIEEHSEIFYSKYPRYEEFKGYESVKPYIKFDYKKNKAIELKLPTFDEWNG